MKSFFFTTLLLVGATSFSQLGVGTTTPNTSAVLELSSTHKGFLAPRVQLTGTSDVSTIASPATGLMVYNLAASGSGASAVLAGFYFFDGAKWQRFISQQPDVTVEFSTTNPNSGSPTFLPNTPASTDYIYVSTVDGSQWTWNGTTYVSFITPSSTPWYLASGTNDALGNKTGNIYRTGSVAIGSTTTPNTSAVLDVSSSNKGFLPPRMTKVQRDLISLPAMGLIVYCTDCDGGFGCLQTNNGTPSIPSWVCLGASASKVECDCSTGFAGNYYKANALTGTTFTTTLVNNTFSSIAPAFTTSDLVLSSSPTISGVTVSAVSPASATILSGGSQIVTYTLSGTPSEIGTLTATWKKLGLSCLNTVSVINKPPTFNCAGTVITSNNYTLTNGFTYSGTVSLPYTSGTAGVTYPSQVLTQNGITLTRNAGTYSTSGNIVYTISGTYTGVANTAVIFTFDVYAGACSAVLFDIIREAIKTGGNTSDLTNYDAAAVNDIVTISAASYSQLKLLSGSSTILSSEALLSGANPPNGTSGGVITRAFPSGAFNTTSYFSAGYYFIAFSIKTKSPSSSANNYSGSRIKFSSSANANFVDYCNAFPSLAAADFTRYYFVIKRPTTALPTTPQMAIYISAANNDLIGGGSSSTSSNNGTGNTATLGTTTLINAPAYIQGIQFPTKQW